MLKKSADFKKVAALAVPFSVCMLVLLFCEESLAQFPLNVWTANGPNVGNNMGITAIAVDPVNPNIIFAGAYHPPTGGVYKTTNNGATWTRSGLANHRILKLRIDPVDPDIVYAVPYWGSSGVVKSTDGGTNWREILGGYIWRFEIAPSDPNILYAVGNAMHISYNRGETWITRPLPNQSYSANELVVHPLDPNIIFVVVTEQCNEDGCHIDVIYRSRNGGLTWDSPGFEGNSSYTFFLKFDPANPNTIYAGAHRFATRNAGAGIYRSTDLGETWTYQRIVGNHREITDLEFDPIYPATLYAVINLGTERVMKSTDGGTTWRTFNNGLGYAGVIDIAFDPTGTFLHSATSTGFFSVRVRR